VAVEDPRPTGLEAVDVSLKTSRMSAFDTGASNRAGRVGDALTRGAGAGAFGWSSFGNWWGGWWSPWEASEMRDDAVMLYPRMLRMGTHTFSYVARATTAGRFVPPSHAEEMYNPALNGRSDGGWFVVREK
jgi:uncharacterized protein YfaS (alpha-2-macroglobulin family)